MTNETICMDERVNSLVPGEEFMLRMKNGDVCDSR